MERDNGASQIKLGACNHQLLALVIALGIMENNEAFCASARWRLRLEESVVEDSEGRDHNRHELVQPQGVHRGRRGDALALGEQVDIRQVEHLWEGTPDGCTIVAEPPPPMLATLLTIVRVLEHGEADGQT